MASSLGLANLRDAAPSQSYEFTFSAAGFTSTIPALWFRYKATDGYAHQYHVSTNGDMVFYRGLTAAVVTLDTTIGSGGIIDVSSASANTFGEVVGIINASTYWEAHLGHVKSGDSINDTLVTTAARTAAVVNIPYSEYSAHVAYLDVAVSDYVSFAAQVVIFPSDLMGRPNSQNLRIPRLQLYSFNTAGGSGLTAGISVTLTAENESGAERLVPGGTPWGGSATAGTLSYSPSEPVDGVPGERFIWKIVAPGAGNVGAGTIGCIVKSFPVALNFGPNEQEFSPLGGPA